MLHLADKTFIKNIRNRSTTNSIDVGLGNLANQLWLQVWNFYRKYSHFVITQMKHKVGLNYYEKIPCKDDISPAVCEILRYDRQIYRQRSCQFLIRIRTQRFLRKLGTQLMKLIFTSKKRKQNSKTSWNLLFFFAMRNKYCKSFLLNFLQIFTKLKTKKNFV